jgi:hypothetical protein
LKFATFVKFALHLTELYFHGLARQLNDRTLRHTVGANDCPGPNYIFACFLLGDGGFSCSNHGIPDALG